MLDAVKHDKKVVAGRLHFVLPTAIGATTIVDDVTEKEMKTALKKRGAEGVATGAIDCGVTPCRIHAASR